MKIKITQYNKYWYYNNINEDTYIQEQYDYVLKYLNFDKLDKKRNYIYFNNKETEKWFRKTYTNTHWLDDIYNNSPEGYQWLKKHWGKGIFKLFVWYSDKQELKTVVNKVINIKLIRGE